tara:strand:+ start:104 stop:337 length:234 start_codon:yes stop_codon:yes gene_type:complete
MKRLRSRGWKRKGAMCLIALTLLSGCLAPRLTGVQTLLDQHEEGLSQAVNAGPEAEAFVRALADLALQYEANIEAGN